MKNNHELFFCGEILQLGDLLFKKRKNNKMFVILGILGHFLK